MLDTIFDNNKLYYFKNTEELPDFDTILSKGDFSMFRPIDASLADSISTIKNKLEGILNEEVELSDFITDSDSFDEEKILNYTLWDLTEEYDWDVFNNIEIVSGIELNNILESENYSPV